MRYNRTEVRQMQIHRLFEIVYILMERKSVTAQELATHFEVSKRTILRDVETLSIAGIPIYTSKGKGGGISILDKFVLNKATINEEEQVQILTSLQSLAVTEQIDTSSIIAKLETLFAKTDTKWLEVDFSRWGKGKADKEKFEILKQAITKMQEITFVYIGMSGESSRRKVYPLKLVFKSKAWYVQAFCRKQKDYRTFKINRMQEIKNTDKAFIGQAFTPPPIDHADMPTKLTHLELQFPAEMAYRIYDEFDMTEIKKNSAGTFEVAVDLPEDGWLYGFLLSFAGNVTIIAPQSVKDELAKKIVEMYLRE